ncbi:ribosome-recycling factor, mitochondrial-like isoform X2 [Amphibalanus amphitrite]|nr:ribosome-recycling factor, mitochondrial-like isoform X2 [Amphibalanus amphitrite]XP_043190416.1 ribosome-recycling factor, mitochondrial-like isoform X2 [Amphibalanus amphitrite]XP_043190417.1 ribosome-recycling factor, mitochondrial-like isoform X2 [Amphibalanus amphitrite]XP_043190418.1 ribosome-recycling factor, mitochondrial-like isoform X2 [Amphibalanus amphitrite]XP_043190419.1 ribosome-recycling factor, mitochondrial-like isoform X2 [Amphibalanus amphitrite]XP_043190420.1 ribosome-r
MLVPCGRVTLARGCQQLTYARLLHACHPRHIRVPLPTSAVACVDVSRLAIQRSGVRSITLSAPDYAKGKDKKKEKKKGAVKVDESEMAELMDVEAFRGRLDAVLDRLRDGFIKQFSVRTSIGSIETLSVPFEGDHYPLNELAQVARKSATLIVINSSAFPQAVGDIVHALQSAGMGLNPQQEGTTVYVQIPKVTKEHRESLVKGAKMACNTAKDKLKEVQNNQLRALKKVDHVSEDLVHSVQNQVTAMAHQYMADADAMLKTKTAELLGEK